MATISIHTVVQPDGKIVIEAPDLTPGQPVMITVAPEANAPGQRSGAGEEETQQTPKPKRRAADILAEAEGHRQFKTAEEVDAYIREERDSWGD